MSFQRFTDTHGGLVHGEFLDFGDSGRVCLDEERQGPCFICGHWTEFFSEFFEEPVCSEAHLEEMYDDYVNL